MRWSELRSGMVVETDRKRSKRYVVFYSGELNGFEVRSFGEIGKITILSVERRNKDFVKIGIPGRQVLCGIQKDGTLFVIETTFHNDDDWNLIA